METETPWTGAMDLHRITDIIKPLASSVANLKLKEDRVWHKSYGRTRAAATHIRQPVWCYLESGRGQEIPPEEAGTILLVSISILLAVPILIKIHVSLPILISILKITAKLISILELISILISVLETIKILELIAILIAILELIAIIIAIL